jgi:hypothetical protein
VDQPRHTGGLKGVVYVLSKPLMSCLQGLGGLF